MQTKSRDFLSLEELPLLWHCVSFCNPSATQARYAFSGCNLLVSNGLLHGGLYWQVGDKVFGTLTSVMSCGLSCAVPLVACWVSFAMVALQRWCILHVEHMFSCSTSCIQTFWVVICCWIRANSAACRFCKFCPVSKAVSVFCHLRQYHYSCWHHGREHEKVRHGDALMPL